MSKSRLAALIALLLLPIAPAVGQTGAIKMRYASDDDFEYCGVLVGTVLAVETESATAGQPRVVTFAVEKVIRGQLHASRITIEWRAPQGLPPVGQHLILAGECLRRDRWPVTESFGDTPQERARIQKLVDVSDERRRQELAANAARLAADSVRWAPDRALLNQANDHLEDVCARSSEIWLGSPGGTDSLAPGWRAAEINVSRFLKHNTDRDVPRFATGPYVAFPSLSAEESTWTRQTVFATQSRGASGRVIVFLLRADTVASGGAAGPSRFVMANAHFGTLAASPRLVKRVETLLGLPHTGIPTQAQDNSQAKKEADQRAVKQREALEQEKLGAERRIRDQANLETLVRTSDAIVLGSRPRTDTGWFMDWGQLGAMKADLWLLDFPRARLTKDRAIVLFGQRDQTLFERWLHDPPDDKPGTAKGDSLRCLAFLRYVGESPKQGTESCFRPVDPVAGILWADNTSITRVRDAIRQRAGAPVEPLPPCGASLGEFAVSDTNQAAGVQLMLARLSASNGAYGRRALIITCGPPHMGSSQDPSAGWFAPCAFPDGAYVDDRAVFPLSVGVPARAMKTVLDSLPSVPELREGRIDPSDSLTITLRRVVEGHERIYESTLDGSAAWGIWRIMKASMGDPNNSRSFQEWWTQVDSRLGFQWIDGTPLSHAPLALTPESPQTQRPDVGSIVGWVVDAATKQPVPNVSIRVFDPGRALVTDERGAFAIRDYPPGERPILLNSEYYEMGLVFITFRAGMIDTVRLSYTPNGVTPRYAPISFPRQEPWYPSPSFSPREGERLHVRVHDGDGRAIPRAYVVLLQGKSRFGGLADDSGDMLFPIIPPGPGTLVIRSSRFEPFARKLDFRRSGSDSLDVRLTLAKH